MFQNIIDEDIEEEDIKTNTEKSKKSINLKNLFSVSNFVLYAVSFMASMDLLCLQQYAVIEFQQELFI